MDIPALLTAIAAIAAALAWPLVVMVLLLAYKRPIGSVAEKIPALFDRVQSLKIGKLEAELEKAVSGSSGASKGEVTPEQIKAAVRVEVQADDLGLAELLRYLDRLCIEYDTIRNTMPSSYKRTSAMTDALIKMRTLAPSTSSRIEAYKSSGSPGSRLAAVAMMQMDPELGDLQWLEDRFQADSPFIFYHAALALRNMTVRANATMRAAIAAVASRALSTVTSFEAGVPDPDTIEVLSSLVRQ